MIFALLAILLVILPFHPFLSTYLVHLIQGTELYREAPQIALLIKAWKEILIIFVIGISAGVWWINRKQSSFDSLDLAIVFFCLVSVLAGVLFTGQGFSENMGQIVWGIKYGVLFLVLFFFVRHVPFTGREKQVLTDIALASAAAVITFGILQATILPEDFLIKFGYNPEYGNTETQTDTISYCHKIENEITHQEFCRVQSTLSGPNQLGAYLLLILPLLFYRMIRPESAVTSFSYSLPFLVGILVLMLTWSRSAWIGALMMAAAFFIVQARKPLWALLYLFLLGGGIASLFFPVFLIDMWDELKVPALAGAVIALFLMLIVFLINASRQYFSMAGAFIFPTFLAGLLYVRAMYDTFFWNIILRPSSSQGHWERSVDGIKHMIENPFGLGLGDAGPASARYANLGETGFLPESWYLQVGLESGFLGLALFLSIIVLLAVKLATAEDENAKPLFLALAGISAAAFFLHSWESSVVAFSFWILAAITLAPEKQTSLLNKLWNFFFKKE